MGRITICRAHHTLYRITWRQFNPLNLDWACDMARAALYRRLPSQRLLNRLRQKLWLTL